MLIAIYHKKTQLKHELAEITSATTLSSKMETLPPFQPPLPPRVEPPPRLEDPDRLADEARKAVAAFLQEGTSRNTARTYKTALQYWGAALEAPVAASVVIQFVADHLEHHPELTAPEVSPYTPSSHATQHLLPLAIDSLLVKRGYKAQLGP